MRLAVISDVHGNRMALDAVLDDLTASPADAVVCLGDMVQGGPQPAETAARLRELAWPTVMGNADAWMLSGVETGAEAPSPERKLRLDAVREWSLSRLSAEDRAYIASFAPTVEVDMGGGRGLLAFHGSPASFDDIILPLTPDEELRRMLGEHAGRLLCGGHTHVQHVRHIGRSFYFNPGSVGLAWRHGQPEGQFRTDPWAEYAVLTAEGGRVALEFRRVPYDASALVDIYLASGRPFADEAAAQYGG